MQNSIILIFGIVIVRFEVNLPMKQAFVFLDIDHPIVAWGAYRGVLVSANAEYQLPQYPVSMMFAGPRRATLPGSEAGAPWRSDGGCRRSH